MLNLKFEAMNIEEKIELILLRYIQNGTSTEKAKQELLNLYNVIKCYTEKDMDNAYEKGYNDGGNAAATDICNYL